jgi:hypothetical protein
MNLRLKKSGVLLLSLCLYLLCLTHTHGVQAAPSAPSVAPVYRCKIPQNGTSSPRVIYMQQPCATVAPEAIQDLTPLPNDKKPSNAERLHTLAQTRKQNQWAQAAAEERERLETAPPAHVATIPVKPVAVGQAAAAPSEKKKRGKKSPAASEESELFFRAMTTKKSE